LHVKIGHIDHERAAIRRVNAILERERRAQWLSLSLSKTCPRSSGTKSHRFAA
jgi:hypothetical protein